MGLHHFPVLSEAFFLVQQDIHVAYYMARVTGGPSHGVTCLALHFALPMKLSDKDSQYIYPEFDSILVSLTDEKFYLHRTTSMFLIEAAMYNIWVKEWPKPVVACQ